MQSVPITTDVVSSNLDQARCTTFCDKVCQWLTTGRWFSPGPPVSTTNKTDRNEITVKWLKTPLSTIKQTNKQYLHLISGNLTALSKEYVVKTLFNRQHVIQCKLLTDY